MRFQHTLTKWLHRQPVQPATINQLQTLLDHFGDYYNQQRPHSCLTHRATPATAYAARLKASPTRSTRERDAHGPVRPDRISKAGNITLRVTADSATPASAATISPPADHPENDERTYVSAGPLSPMSETSHQ